MKPSKKFAAFLFLVLLAAFAGSGLPSPAHAQAPATGQLVKQHFTVRQMLYNAIQVQDLANQHILTFTYADSIRAKMQKLFDRGGYQYGDKVEIWYETGSNMALKIKGKASKPL
jgi:hypothetical protein